MRLEDLKAGARVGGVVPGETVEVLAATHHGSEALELTYKRADGGVAQRVLYRADEAALLQADGGSRPFDADAADFRLVAEAQRISLAGLFDPMLAVATSNVQPLPHQIRAVYGPMLDGRPLRYLLADDPGAGKTIMAGLYIKELLLRDDVKRCLIVAPGGLVEQWQDELHFKFGLSFRILTPQLVDAQVNQSPFDDYPLLIARMDQLSRNEDLKAQLADSEWDLLIVDEAHRMAAHYFGNELRKSKRFELGELFGQITRHLLLMTATPHSGKNEDYELFLTLLDADRFAGKRRKGTGPADTADIMRRMVKEDLLTFEGTKLFPDRIAQTVPYELTEAEQELYEQVTNYVRQGMDRAAKLDGKAKNTVGFALTVLQRRLASSPAAIHNSLVRRADRLQRRKQLIEAGRDPDAGLPSVDPDDLDNDDFSAEETEELETEVLDAATAARTVAELDTEIAELKQLAAAAKSVRDAGTDRKWSELRRILEDNTLSPDTGEETHKLIVFTEHRDTLDYLAGRIESLLGRPGAVECIHGGVRRSERRRITEEFSKNPECQILLATDAAGEGLNLQAAHLMVNYDLPWNPNRIEQRFGRVHRIGQKHVCRLWNLVATNTREGMVFERLLEKVEEQRKAYGGKVFDVLGEAFAETPLRDLLIDAITTDSQLEVQLRMQLVIDEHYADGVRDLLAQRALASDVISDADLDDMRRQMDEARARRLQPHYVEWMFRQAFTRLGGRLARREKGRYEISNVPARLRHRASSSAGAAPIATRYDRVTFSLDTVEADGRPTADLLAPGHPLHDAVTAETITQLSGALTRGTVLVSDAVEEPQLLVGVYEEVIDGTGEAVARRFGYAYASGSGDVVAAGPAPYLDCVAAPIGPVVDAARRLPWLADAESRAVSWIIANQLPAYLAEVLPRRSAELVKVRTQVTGRLNAEINRLAGEALAAREKEAAGAKPKETADSLSRKAADFEARLERRLARLDRQAQMSTKPPRVMTAALVLPLAMVEAALPADAPIRAKETKEVERRGVELVLAQERSLGRVPEEQAFNNPGFDILSALPDGETIRIEVKARLAGSDDFFVTHNEVVVGKNAVPRYRLAMVSVDPKGAEYDEVRYLADPFAGVELGDAGTGVRLAWKAMWAKGTEPF